MANRVCFLVDGFNVYHSIREAMEAQPGASMKWLDLHALCTSYLSAIGRDAVLERVFYFSAPAEHRLAKDPDTVNRHMTYIAALRSTGVEVVLGRFKNKQVWCKHCGREFIRHEEKETDVAIAAKLLELCLLNACDTVVLVTGDTDLGPAVRTARRLVPAAKVWVAFPYGRHNAELKALAHGTLKIKAKRYAEHQFPNPVGLPDGKVLWKPTSW